MNWHSLQSLDDVNTLIDRSLVVPCLILKHSTRCPISSMAMRRLEMNWDLEDGQVETYYLDLIRYREVSNYVASTFGVQHESPQALLIKDGSCTYDASHLDIRVDEFRPATA
ncbi:MAG: bacillithiol system redox-active protein YtxJ [Bacteroidota bacterium]